MTPGTQGVIVDRAVLGEVREALRDTAQALGDRLSRDAASGLPHASCPFCRRSVDAAEAALAKLSALTKEPSDA